MAVLDRFDTPGRLSHSSDEEAQEWNARVADLFANPTGRGSLADFPQLYDPTVSDTPDDHQVVNIVWSAFPAQLLAETGSEKERWERADSSRRFQDEYCEWGVERDPDGKITSVTFTTELPEYFEHLAAHDPERLVNVYREFVGPEVQLNDLIRDGQYSRVNRFNDPDATDRPPVHLAHGPNTLGAAVALVAEATRPRKRNGELLTTKETLTQCLGGAPLRNSDPQIAAVLNGAARAGDEITLQDPIGLYIDGLTTVGMETPDGADPASFWTIERGSQKHAMRARYEVPADRGYAVGDITINGRPIEAGAQIADRVTVRITGLVKPADHEFPPLSCD